MTAPRPPAAGSPQPVPSLAGLHAYAPPRHLAPVDLVLSGNEGDHPPAALFADLAADAPRLLRSYPRPAVLERALAERMGIAPDRVFVAAGGDEVIDRACRAYLAPGRRIVLPEPTFVMFAHYAALAGAAVDRVDWPGGSYPLDEVLSRIGADTAIVTVVSPNNPTGAVATAADLQTLSAAAPHAVLIVDLAYTEYADVDLTAAALALPNAIVVRTVSKAWGLAGLRIGYGAGPPALLRPMRAAGGPFSVSGLSLALAERALRDGEERARHHVGVVRDERRALQAVLRDLGMETPDSQGNFALARTGDPVWLRDGLAGLGIAVRVFPGDDALADAVRITCPGDGAAFARLGHALRATCRPQAVLFDMDGVLADVSRSYRAAITQTAAHFGVDVDAAAIRAAKAAGDANNDWVLTHRLVSAAGGDATLAQVTEAFEKLYQGDEDQPGLHREETLLPDPARLRRLARRARLGVVTGRPRADAERFLHDHGLEDVFATVICMEDAPLKPDPAPVRAALAALDVEHAWLVGDTPDDVRAARAAGVVPLGVLAPGEGPADGEAGEILLRAGAARVLDHVDQIEELCP